MDIVQSAFVKFASSVIRTLLASGTAWLVSRKYINSEIATQLTVLVMAVAPILAWSFIERYVVERFHLDRLLLALRLPENSTLDDLKRAKEGTNEPTK